MFKIGINYKLYNNLLVLHDVPSTAKLLYV